MNVADFTLVLSTPEQSVQQCKAEHVPWSRGVEFNRFYVEQIERRKTGPWARDNALIRWALVKRDDLTGEVFAACETYRRKAFIKGEGGNVEEGWMYGIASVVTPTAHRRNGYATRMLSLLHYMLGSADHLPPFPAEWGAPPPALPSQPDQRAEEGTPPESIPRSPPSSQTSDTPSFLDSPRPDYLPVGIGSILWSDVGSHFYSKCTIGTSHPGWVVDSKANTEIKWTLSTAPESALEGWDILYQKDLAEVAPALSTASREAVGSGEKGAWAMDATNTGTLDFVPLRNAWSEDPLRPRFSTLPVGLRQKRSQGDVLAVVALFATHNDAIADALLVTVLHNVTPEVLPGLLDALDVMGRKEGRNEGIVWGLPKDGELAGEWRKLRKIEADITRPEKNGHLLGVAWYGPQEERGRLLDTGMWGWC